MSNENKRITIVGAGLTGALLGVLLGKRGYTIDLIERRPRQQDNDADSGRSINLALAQRGIDALKLAGVYDAIEPLLIPMNGRMLHLEDGRQVFSPYGQRANEVIYSVSRRELNRILVSRAVEASAVNVRFGRKCTDVQFAQRVALFQDQSTGELESRPFDLIIGADGAGSRVRRSMMEHVGGQSTSSFLDHNYKELEIPAGPGQTWKLEKEALHIWPRGDYMLIALPNLDGSFTVTLFLPKTGHAGGPGFDGLKTPGSVNEFFDRNFPTAKALMPDLVEDFLNNPAGRLGTVRCEPWNVEDRGVIVGDAAHAIVPFHGQGMNAAFEDCLVLSNLLDQFEDDWMEVNECFNATRKPDTDAIAQMAIENYTTMRSTVTDPKYGLKKEVGFELERRLPDVFIPRYSMVMFHSIPYAQVLQRGRVQDEVLEEIVAEIDDLDAVDWGMAEKTARAKLAASG